MKFVDSKFRGYIQQVAMIYDGRSEKAEVSCSRRITKWQQLMVTTLEKTQKRVKLVAFGKISFSSFFFFFF